MDGCTQTLIWTTPSKPLYNHTQERNVGAEEVDAEALRDAEGEGPDGEEGEGDGDEGTV